MLMRNDILSLKPPNHNLPATSLPHPAYPFLHTLSSLVPHLRSHAYIGPRAGGGGGGVRVSPRCLTVPNKRDDEARRGEAESVRTRWSLVRLLGRDDGRRIVDCLLGVREGTKCDGRAAETVLSSALPPLPSPASFPWTARRGGASRVSLYRDLGIGFDAQDKTRRGGTGVGSSTGLSWAGDGGDGDGGDSGEYPVCVGGF